MGADGNILGNLQIIISVYYQIINLFN